MRKIAMMAGLVLAATSLGGCQSMFGPSLAEADAGKVDMSEYFQQRLLMGKMHLAANRPTRAINAFRQASYDPQYAAEAFNGMAIAYDRMGRADLAARYFAQAVDVAPTDERFARNLARFEGRGSVPIPSGNEVAPVEMAVNEAAQADRRGAVTVEHRPNTVTSAVTIEKAPQTRVAHVSQGQVAVGRDEGSVVRTALANAAPARIVVETQSRADQVASRVRRNARARKSYPIRMVFNDAPKGVWR